MNWTERLQNFYSFMSQMTADFINGEKIRADKDMYDSRMSTCYSCDLLNKENNKCKGCGCNMVLKCGLYAAKCPKGKW